jgi:hypothetical protein
MLASSRQPAKQGLNIVERPLPRSRLDVGSVSLSAYAYLFGELISYAMDRAASITELEDRCGGVEAGRVCVCVCVCV